MYRIREAIACFVTIVILSGWNPLFARGFWLDVPFVKQEPKGCGAAAISMLMQYWKANSVPIQPEIYDPAKIMERIYTPEAEGIFWKDMQSYFQLHGFRTFVFRGSWQDAADHLGKGRPLIVSLYQNPIHYVVLSGMDPENQLIFVHDPAKRKLLSLERKEFEKAWKAQSNWTLLALPLREID